jgi:uncharacterized membrane protein
MHERQTWIAHWRTQNALSAQQVPEALRLAGIPPSRREWCLWIDRLLLWLGVAALLAGLIFFVAANWSGMGRFAKFALAEIVIAASLVTYAMGARLRHGAAALLAASLAVGALLALIGQTYQTGADTFELFLVWALLIAPWTLLARLPALWVLWLAILHVAFYFYTRTFQSLWGFSLHNEHSLVVVAGFDFSALLAWEFFSSRGREWMSGRWTPRLLALAGGVVVSALAVIAILDGRERAFYFLLYGMALAGLYAGYRHAAPDLFMLAGMALSAIVVATTGLARVVLDHGVNMEALLLLAMFSMLATAAAAWWLRQVAQAHRERLPQIGDDDRETPR